MRRFTALLEALDATNSTDAKVAAMAGYFREAPPEDAAWGLFFLAGWRVKRLVSAPALAGWSMELLGVPSWLFADCHSAVGDLGETIALLIDTLRGGAGGGGESDVPLHVWMEERVLPLKGLEPDEARRRIVEWWKDLGAREIHVLDKLLTGSLRAGVSRTLVVRAMARVAGLPPAAIAHRLMGDWRPTGDSFRRLVAAEAGADDPARPYPFFLASPLAGPPSDLGERAAWLAEWKFDGIRAQLVRRAGGTWLWSRGEEAIADRFPEIRDAGAALPPGTVLDGEVLAWRDARPLPFAVLQRRIGREKPTAEVLREAPAAFVAFDLLEEGGADRRDRPLAERRARLAALAAGARPPILLSPAIDEPSWEGLARAREESRARIVEGIMIKRLDSPYGTGRKRGDWWKWKVEPYSVDAVLIYAQTGHGRRASLFTDYTFAVWDGPALVPIAKAYSGLSDAEILELDRWVRAHTTDRFGPVRRVEPVQVFEIGFEGIAASTLHRSGIAVRFPRILRWRKDKAARDADTVERVRDVLAAAS